MDFKYYEPHEIEYIYIQPTKQRWSPGKRLIKSELEEGWEEVHEEFMGWMAFRYKEEIIKAIDKQRYDYKWEPLTIPYYRYKKKHGLSLKIWEATGFLKEHIVVKGKVDHVEVGFRFWQTYPDSNVHPVLVARCLEFGVTSGSQGYRIPPRPLWRPLQRYMRKHVRKFWEEFQEEYDIEEGENE